MKKAIKRYDSEYNIQNYYDSEKSATYFILDTETDFVYAIKILIVLVYLLKNNNTSTYKEFLYEKKKEGHIIKGQESFSRLFEDMLSNNNRYTVVYLEGQLRKDYIKCRKSSKEGYDKKVMRTERINHGPFRKEMLFDYGHIGCALCGMSSEKLLIVSHIKEWHESDPKEKTNKCNALLLCPNHDKVFDRHMITFDDSGSIIISASINADDRKLLNIKPSDKLRIELTKEHKLFLSVHRNIFNCLSTQERKS